MATRTTYTTTISVPVYACWKCEKCDHVNFSPGFITYKGEESTCSKNKLKNEETKSRASSTARANWKEYALQIITNPNHNPVAMRNDFFLQETKCKKCGAKPKWDKDQKYLTVFALCIFPLIMSGIAAFGIKTSIIAWLIFLAFLSILIYTIYSESHYKHLLANLPKKYTPVIGSLNDELIEYANNRNVHLCTPEECILCISRTNS